MGKSNKRLAPPSLDELRVLKDQARVREAYEAGKAKDPDKSGISVEQVGGPRLTGDRTQCAAPLAAFHDIVVRRDTTGRPLGAWRTNPFRLLSTGKSPTLSEEEADAGMRLLMVYAIAKGLDGESERQNLGRIDGGDPDAWGRADRRIKAIKRYGLALEFVCDGKREKNASRRILEALMFAMVEEDRPLVWRGIVQRETGLDDADKQSDRIKAACEELAAYFRYERTIGKAA